MAGQSVTAAATGFAIAESSVLPGHSALVVGGTSVSLGTDGVLDVGGSTTTLVGQTGLDGNVTAAGKSGEGDGSDEGAGAFTGSAKADRSFRGLLSAAAVLWLIQYFLLS